MDYKRRSLASAKQLPPLLINALPSEVLIRIFLLTAGSRSCSFRNHPTVDFTPTVPKHPDSLLLVCHRWYAIAISSRSLWSHIDIVLSCPQAELFLTRAKAHVTRAQQTPLDIHIIDPGIHSRYRMSWLLGHSSDADSDGNQDPDNTSSEDGNQGEDDSTQDVVSEGETWLDEFRPNVDNFDCLGPAPKFRLVRSLELSTHCKYHMSQLVALQHYLSRCAPGVLTQLLIQTRNPYEEPLGHFIEYGYVGGSLDVPVEALEQPLNSITTLHLHGLYPYWTSQAYCGLVDLHLGGEVQIPEQNIVEILRSSPELRALRLCCRITHPTERENSGGEYEGEPPFDVHLKDLEILDISSLNYNSATTLLRRLSYSTKPLRLCFSRVDRDDNISYFLGHSKNLNVKELRITHGALHDLHDYLERYTSLHTLVIGEWDDSKVPFGLSRLRLLRESNLYWYSPGDKGFDTYLDTLYVIRISIPYNELRVMVDYYSIRRLVLWRSPVRMAGRSEGPTDDEMAALCQVVDTLKPSDPNPVEQ